MQAIQEPFITEAEYDEIEAQSDVKHEYFNGEIFAMAGGTHTHARLVFNVGATLREQLRGKHCRGIGSEQRVRIEATNLQTYPDAIVFCPPARFEGKGDQVLLSPTLIIEVLSDGTETYDRTTKFQHYRQIPELADYLLISQERVLVEHFSRQDDGAWSVRFFSSRQDHVRVPALDLTLPVAAIYEDIEAPEGLPPLHPPAEDEA